MSGLFQSLLQTDAAGLVARGFEVVQAAGMREVGAVAMGGALLTLISIWVLYRYLFRASDGNVSHVTFSH
jgi:hypothetical protein